MYLKAYINKGWWPGWLVHRSHSLVELSFREFKPLSPQLIFSLVSLRSKYVSMYLKAYISRGWWFSWLACRSHSFVEWSRVQASPTPIIFFIGFFEVQVCQRDLKTYINRGWWSSWLARRSHSFVEWSWFLYRFLWSLSRSVCTSTSIGRGGGL